MSSDISHWCIVKKWHTLFFNVSSVTRSPPVLLLSSRMTSQRWLDCSLVLHLYTASYTSIQWNMAHTHTGCTNHSFFIFIISFKLQLHFWTVITGRHWLVTVIYTSIKRLSIILGYFYIHTSNDLRYRCAGECCFSLEKRRSWSVSIMLPSSNSMYRETRQHHNLHFKCCVQPVTL